VSRDSGEGRKKKPIVVRNQEGGKMEAYRIDSFGSVDGIVLRSSEDPGLGRRRS